MGARGGGKSTFNLIGKGESFFKEMGALGIISVENLNNGFPSECPTRGRGCVQGRRGSHTG